LKRKSHLSRLLDIYYEPSIPEWRKNKFSKRESRIFTQRLYKGVEFTDTCLGCGACAWICPGQAIGIFDEGETRRIYYDRASCARCLTCLRTCPKEGIDRDKLLTGGYIKRNSITTFELIRCSVCGRPVCTKKEIELLRESEDVLEPKRLCQKCKRREVAKGYMVVPEEEKTVTPIWANEL
jgi:ferredoxin